MVTLVSDWRRALFLLHLFENERKLTYMDTNKNKTIYYNNLVEAIGLPTGTNVQFFTLNAESPLITSSQDCSILFLDAVLVALCRKGSCVAIVGGAPQTLEAGQLLIVFMGTHCRFSSISPDFEADVFFGRIPPRASYNSLSKAFPRIKSSPVLSLMESEYATLTAFFSYVKQTVANPYNSHRSELDVNILTLLHDELADIFLNRNFAVKESTPDEMLVKNFHIMLSTSAFEHREVEYFANQFKMSSKRFAQKIKKITGSTPSDLITSAVIRNAKRLLSSTELSSGDIAAKLNFATPSFFCRYFRRYTGVTPSQWRTQNASKR